MNFSDYGTYLSAVALVAACVAFCDLFLSGHIKQQVVSGIEVCCRWSEDQHSRTFYFFSLACSLALTLFVVSAVGGLNALQNKTNGLRSALESTGPLLFALAFKIIFWDYFMAMKSAIISKAVSYARPGRARSSLIAVTVLTDLCVTTILTAFFIASVEAFQLHEVKKHEDGSGQGFLAVIAKWIDVINIVSTHALRITFYWLNGSVFYYLSAVLHWLSSPSSDIFDWASIKRAPFTMIACVIGLLFFVALTSAYWAGRY